jgi:DNA polymerase elongation subunit (family B)
MSVVSLDFASLYPRPISGFSMGDDFDKSAKYILDRNKDHKYTNSLLLDKYGLRIKDLFDFPLVKSKVRDYEINKILYE